MRFKPLSLLAALFAALCFARTGWSYEAALTPVLIYHPEFMDEYIGLIRSGSGYFLTSDGYPVRVGKDGKWMYVISGNSLFTTSVSGNELIMRMAAYESETLKAGSGSGVFPSVTGVFIPIKKP